MTSNESNIISRFPPNSFSFVRLLRGKYHCQKPCPFVLLPCPTWNLVGGRGKTKDIIHFFSTDDLAHSINSSLFSKCWGSKKQFVRLFPIVDRVFHIFVAIRGIGKYIPIHYHTRNEHFSRRVQLEAQQPTKPCRFRKNAIRSASSRCKCTFQNWQRGPPNARFVCTMSSS